MLVRFLHVFIRSKHFSTYLTDLITYSVIYSTQINGGFPVKTNWLFEGILFLQYIQHHIFVNSVFKSENNFLMNSSREFCRTTVTRWCYLSCGRRHLRLQCSSCEANSFRRISFFAKWSWLAPFLGISQKPPYRWLNLKSFSVRPAVTSTSAKDLSNEKELLCILWVYGLLAEQDESKHTAQTTGKLGEHIMVIATAVWKTSILQNHLQYCETRLIQTPGEQAIILLISYCDMKPLDEKEFLQTLERVPWETAFIFKDIDDAVRAWEHVSNSVLDAHFPWHVKCVELTTKVPWMAKAWIKQLARRSDRLDNWANYSTARNKNVSALHVAKLEF